jgi:hypothetical protein
MRYEKPVVMELGSRPQRAAGQGPLACISGGAADHIYESCGTGTGAGWSCGTGSGVTYAYPLCVGGSAATGAGDCFSGTSVSYYCGAGTGGGNDPRGCRSGPVPGP